MGYYHEDSPYHALLTLLNTATASATPDGTFEVPTDWDPFWLNCKSDLSDIRITEADGETLCDFEVTALNYAARTATIVVDACTAEAVEGCYCLHLYWGDASAADVSTTTTITSAKTIVVDQGRPGLDQVVFVGPRPGATAPEQQIQKASAETRKIWFDITAVLRRRRKAYAGHDLYAEPFKATMDVQKATVSQSSMFAATGLRFVRHNRSTYLSALVQAGVSGDEHTVGVLLKTVIPYADGSVQATDEIRQARVELFVTDTVEN